MTHKEKAEELVLKFMNLQEPNYNWFHKELAKQCALIAVDEILNQFIGIFNAFKKQSIIFGKVEDSENFKYWQQVKQEIEKL